MYSQILSGARLPQTSVTDIYGGTPTAKQIGYVPDTGVAASASGELFNVNDDKAPAMSWVAFVAILVFIRVLYELLPMG